MVNEILLVAIITAIASIAASSGFWTYVQSRRDRKSLANRLLIGIAHDRISHLANTYICRGWITPDEFENLNNYLFAPYISLGGNGYVGHLMDSVKKLQLVEAHPDDHVCRLIESLKK